MLWFKYVVQVLALLPELAPEAPHAAWAHRAFVSDLTGP